MAKTVLIGLAGLVAVLALAALAILLASELGGEVVTLTTRDEGGAERTTHLWVVDHQGFAWLRAGNPRSGWLSRLRRDPRVRLSRGGVSASYIAEPDPAQRTAVERLMAEKYGLPDRLIGVVRSIGGEKSVPVRLIPSASPPERRAPRAP